MNDGSNFDAGEAGVFNGNYFGFPWNADESEIIILNVPWDATTSYRRGTSKGPEAMIKASTQLDFYSFDNPGATLIRCGTDTSLHNDVTIINREASLISAHVISSLESGANNTDPSIQSQTYAVNEFSLRLEELVKLRCNHWLQKGKKIILAGGEHSVPIGYLQSLAGYHPSFGILQIDAHADLRESYEGFVHSHASIMFNALEIRAVKKIVQVGVRDVSISEVELSGKDHRIKMISDHDINSHLFCGGNWFTKCREIVSHLPDKVYISFDIDGLSPVYCPNTGTPVPGGLTPDSAIYLIRMIAESGREIIGTDLCEVAPGRDEWDASVGARLLYRMAVLIQHSGHPTTA